MILGGPVIGQTSLGAVLAAGSAPIPTITFDVAVTLGAALLSGAFSVNATASASTPLGAATCAGSTAANPRCDASINLGATTFLGAAAASVGAALSQSISAAITASVSVATGASAAITLGATNISAGTSAGAIFNSTMTLGSATLQADAAQYSIAPFYAYVGRRCSAVTIDTRPSRAVTLSRFSRATTI